MLFVMGNVNIVYINVVSNQVHFPIIPRAPIDSLVDKGLRDDGAESAKRLNMALVLFKFSRLFLKKQEIQFIR